MSPGSRGLTAPPARGWAKDRDGWRCPECGKRFAQRGQTHACGVVSLEHHFRRRPRARALFRAFLGAVEKAGGPVRLSVARTRIGLITRITFAAVYPRKEHLRVHIVLRRRVRSDRIGRVEHFPPYWVHFFEIWDESDLDGEMRGLLREACRVGARGTSGRTP